MLEAPSLAIAAPTGQDKEPAAEPGQPVTLRGSFSIEAIRDAYFISGQPYGDWEAFTRALAEHGGPCCDNDKLIAGWPAAPMTPIRDMVLAQRIGQEKIDSVFLPDGAVESLMCRVLAVGPGLLLDDGVMRPPPCRRGEIIWVTPNDGHRVVLNGEEYWVFEACEVVAKIEIEGATGFGNETCANR